MFSPPISPGQQWMSKLQKLYLLHPHVLNRDSDLKSWTGIVVINTWYIVLIIRYIIGTFWPQLALSLGNYFNVLGIAGQVLSLVAAMAMVLNQYLRIRLLFARQLPSLHQLVAYDDPKKKTILTGKFGLRQNDFLRKSVFFLKIASIVTSTNLIVMIFFMAVVTPVIVYGVSVSNILYWFSLWLSFLPIPCYWLGQDWVCIFGTWFVIKCHYDVQADCLMERMELLVESDLQLTDREVTYLDYHYRLLVSRVKEFDKLSKDLISPYRFVLSYVCGLCIFGAHLQDNPISQIAMDTLAVIYYVATLVFLSSACTLSNRRKKMYFFANQLAVKAARQRTSIRQLVVLRRMIKSLGNEDIPTLCLMDTSNKEFEPLEFVEFIAETFSNFLLAANLYDDLVRR